MARYIDADKMHQFVEGAMEEPLPHEWFWALRIIDNAPTEDVAEVKHGEWLLDGRCSECLENPLTTHKNYCPNCGADMRGKEI